MPAIVQMLMLLVQLFPAAMKAIAAWQEYHGQQLTRCHRKRLAGDIKSAVDTAIATKDTSGLENILKNLGKAPQTPAADPPNPQNPS